MKLIIFTLIIFFMGISSAWSQTNGESLLKDCEAAIKYESRTQDLTGTEMQTGICIGFIQAILNTQIKAHAFLPYYWQACFPSSGISTMQAIRITVKYLQDNPQLLDITASSLVMASMSSAYPCRDS